MIRRSILDGSFRHSSIMDSWQLNWWFCWFLVLLGRVVLLFINDLVFMEGFTRARSSSIRWVLLCHDRGDFGFVAFKGSINNKLFPEFSDVLIGNFCCGVISGFFQRINIQFYRSHVKKYIQEQKPNHSNSQIEIKIYQNICYIFFILDLF